jgi:diguanylate cyclase (GGDEF)-like protein
VEPKFNSISVVENIVRFTSHQESEIILSSLFLALDKLLPEGKLRLFQVTKTPVGDYDMTLLAFSAKGAFCYVEEIDTKPASNAFNKALKKAASHYDVEATEDGDKKGWHVIYPTFQANNELFLVLVHSTNQLTPELYKLIHGILKVYTNYVGLIEKSQTDTLTGLYNRETLEERITKILVQGDDDLYKSEKLESDKRKGNENLKYWLAVIDVDHFKAINDNYGHLYGDEVLILVARLLTSGCMRAGDLVYRYGGEEFVTLIRAVDRDAAYSAFERIRKMVETHSFPQINQVTISTGFVELAGQQSASDAIGMADEAMYVAKRNGRNQVQCYETLIESGEIVVAEKVSNIDVELF